MMWTMDEMMIRDLVPDLTLYNSAIRGCGMEGEWQMSVSLLRGTKVNDQSALGLRPT